MKSLAHLKAEIESTRDTGAHEFTTWLDWNNFDSETSEYLFEILGQDPNVFVCVTDLSTKAFLEVEFLDCKAAVPEAIFAPSHFLRNLYDSMTLLSIHNQTDAYSSAEGVLRLEIRKELRKLGIDFLAGMRALDRDYCRRHEAKLKNSKLI